MMRKSVEHQTVKIFSRAGHGRLKFFSQDNWTKRLSVCGTLSQKLEQKKNLG